MATIHGMFATKGLNRHTGYQGQAGVVGVEILRSRVIYCVK